MSPIFHLAERADWAEAEATGWYTTSTRGRTLAEVGFIHAAGARQWPHVRAQFYADLPDELLLLEIDPDRIADPVVWEVGDPDSGEAFPHLYGPLPTDAVVTVLLLPAPHGP